MNDSDSLEDITSVMKFSDVSLNNTEEHNLQVKPTVISCSMPNESITNEQLLDPELEVFDRIANKLLRSGLLLTALELHAELIERGKELSRLRDFFDNPHNFEKHFENSFVINRTDASSNLFPKNVTRSPSEQTFESLDFTHYSDDDLERHGDERVAVLEFELRKARQTINSLRASLTMSTTGQSFLTENIPADIEHQAKSGNSGETLLKTPQNTLTSLPDCSSMSDNFSIREFYYRGSADGDSCPGEDDRVHKISNNFQHQDILDQFGLQGNENVNSPTSFKYSLAAMIKPHEKRAINYLINEYLMANSYKLTSITFSDENADQDFDKWEDVGLNTDRPPDLLKLYRHFWQNCSSLLRTNSNAATIVGNHSTTKASQSSVGDFQNSSQQ